MIRSPCKSICVFEEDENGQDYCIGCFRNTLEIQSWYDYTEEEKAELIVELEKREERQP